MNDLRGSRFIPEFAPYVDSSHPYEGKRFISDENWTSTILGGIAASAILVPSVTHLNEAIRASATAVAYAAGGATASGLALGATTFALELAGGIVTADVFATENGSKLTEYLGKKLEQVRIKKIPETNMITDLTTAFIVGTPLATTLKNQQNSTRSRRENRRFALQTAAFSGAVMGAEGFAISEGIQHPDPLSLSIAALAIGTSITGVSMFVRKNKRNADVNTTQEVNDSSVWYEPRYDMREEELKALETEMVALASEKYPKRLVAMWISPYSKYANLLRHEEAKHFPEIEGVDGEIEDSTTFLALIDTRSDSMRVVHGATITNYAPSASADESRPDQTGIYTVDSLIDLQNFSTKEFEDFYNRKGVNLQNTFACETNFRIGERTKNFRGMRPSDLVYLLLLDRVLKNDPSMRESAVFASINEPSIKSFDRFGIDYEPLMGRTDFKTEESQVGRFSMPIAILPSRANKRKLKSLINGAKLLRALPSTL